jgi:DNA-binding NtrC family response regulator
MSYIVYIDDEQFLLEAFEMLYQDSTQLQIKTFLDPMEGVKFINSEDVALVFCDYRLPGLMGNEVKSKIEKNVPFYIVTGDLDVEDAEAYTGILRKPLEDDDVIGIIKSL